MLGRQFTTAIQATIEAFVVQVPMTFSTGHRYLLWEATLALPYQWWGFQQRNDRRIYSCLAWITDRRNSALVFSELCNRYSL